MVGRKKKHRKKSPAPQHKSESEYYYNNYCYSYRYSYHCYYCYYYYLLSERFQEEATCVRKNLTGREKKRQAARPNENWFSALRKIDCYYNDLRVAVFHATPRMRLIIGPCVSRVPPDHRVPQDNPVLMASRYVDWVDTRIISTKPESKYLLTPTPSLPSPPSH